MFRGDNLKSMFTKMAFIMGGAGVVGYLYYKKHPDKLKAITNISMDAEKKMLDVLEQDCCK